MNLFCSYIECTADSVPQLWSVDPSLFAQAGQVVTTMIQGSFRAREYSVANCLWHYVDPTSGNNTVVITEAYRPIYSTTIYCPSPITIPAFTTPTQVNVTVQVHLSLYSIFLSVHFVRYL